jgi:hypothetical protein
MVFETIAFTGYAIRARGDDTLSFVRLLPFRRRVAHRRRGRRLVLLAGIGAAVAAFRQRKLAENDRQDWPSPPQ